MPNRNWTKRDRDIVAAWRDRDGYDRRVKQAKRYRDLLVQILGWLLALAGIALVVAAAAGWLPLE